MSFTLAKRSGKTEPFDEGKVRRSLARSGVAQHEQQPIIEAIYARKPRSTTELHQFIAHILKKTHPARAARYNLKQALVQLGPAGFPFERFIAFLFNQQGYVTSLNQTRTGACADHEIDIVANKDRQHLLIECKFHHRLGLASDIKVPLYVKARFDDIVRVAENTEVAMTTHELWITTNTRFTKSARIYAHCMGITLLSWRLPANNSLPILIDRYNIHPITALSGLKKAHVRTLIAHHIVTCSQLVQHPKILEIISLPLSVKQQILDEAQQVCMLTQRQMLHKKSN